MLFRARLSTELGSVQVPNSIQSTTMELEDDEHEDDELEKTSKKMNSKMMKFHERVTTSLNLWQRAIG